jgi:hypothetical protein
VNGELAAMLAELNTVHSTVTTLLTDRFEAPLYSLPNSSFGQFLPRQIGESIYVDNEIRTLLEYQRRVEELNRGLERARDAHARQQEIRRIEEFGRNQKKAEALISEGGPTAPWALAKEAIERARGLAQQKRRAWRRRFHLKR